jgi:hypothetical protein
MIEQTAIGSADSDQLAQEISDCGGLKFLVVTGLTKAPFEIELCFIEIILKRCVPRSPSSSGGPATLRCACSRHDSFPSEFPGKSPDRGERLFGSTLDRGRS